MRRRSFLQWPMGLALSAGMAPSVHSTNQEKPILVVVELSGGNDGLNSIVPIGNDDYYRARPQIGIAPQDVLPLDADYGFNPGMLGFKRLWDDGRLAIVHGCGYARASAVRPSQPNSAPELGAPVCQ